jgi:oxygen-independent coproporphyrinogen-3 oxidase
MIIEFPTSIYIHIPFCVKRCGYCDFNTYAGKESLIPAYVEALCEEIAYVAVSLKHKIQVHTIFFGGGTPSLLTISQLDLILKMIITCYDLRSDAEISLEANPGTVNADHLSGLRGLGFNRLSLGVQSTLAGELRLLERIHSREDIFLAFDLSRAAGFSNLNMDLIYGLPGQTIQNWKDSLNEAMKLQPDHLSLYALTIEKGTRFGVRVQNGLMETPNPDDAADMYEWASQELERSGFHQYEISNWAKTGMECKHNLQYWRNLPYLGFGAGAHGFLNGQRVSNALRIMDYIGRMKRICNGDGEAIQGLPVTPATVSQKKISRHTSMQETLMLGLRLTREGVKNQEFFERFGENIEMVFGNEVTELLNVGLVEWCNGTLRLTKHGRLLGNQVFLRFVN